MSAETEIETADDEGEETRRRMHPEVQVLNLILRELDKLAAKRGQSSAARVAQFAYAVFDEHQNQI